MNWLEFGRKKLSEGPNVVCQPGRHAGCALLPLGLKPWDVSEFNASGNRVLMKKGFEGF